MNIAIEAQFLLTFFSTLSLIFFIFFICNIKTSYFLIPALFNLFSTIFVLLTFFSVFSPYLEHIPDFVFLVISGFSCILSFVSLAKFAHRYKKAELRVLHEKSLNKSFSRFVPNEFLRFMGKSSITELFSGEYVNQTMCVMNIRLRYTLHSSGIEALSKITRLELINSLLLELNPVVIEKGGFIDRFQNDGFVVLLPADPCNATQCALAIARAVNEHNFERLQQELPIIQVSMGLSRGDLALGAVGSQAQMERAIVSNALFYARELSMQAASREIGILVSEDFAILLGAPEPCPCAILSQGKIKIKGSVKPCTLFEIRELV